MADAADVRAEIGRILRFLAVGGGLFVLDFSVFTGLISAAVSVPLAQIVSVTVRTLAGFVVHKWVTFRGDTADDASTTGRQGLAYLVQAAANAPVSVVVVWGCVGLLDGWAPGGKVLAELVMLVEVYLLYRVVVYSPSWFGGAGGEQTSE